MQSKNKKDIRLNIVDIAQLDRVNIKDFFLNIISKDFNIIKEKENPDLLIFSDHGREHFKYNCLKIYFSDENIRPDFNLAHFCIGFDHIIYDRYMRFPLWLAYTDDLALALNKNKFDYESEYKKDKFASFVVSNNFACMSKREEIFHKLSSYKKVDSGGSFLNNIGKKIDSKIDFQKNYKFALCIENSSYSGYSTEKLLQGFASGCVPIYFGDKDISNDKFALHYNGGQDQFRGFNKEAFINIHDFKNLDECIEYIKEVDNNDLLYKKYLNAPALSQDYVNFYKNKLREFIKEIILHPDFSSNESSRVIWRQLLFLESKMTILQKIIKKPAYIFGSAINSASKKILKKNIVNIKKYDIYYRLINKKF